MCLTSCGGGGGRLAWLVGRGLMFGPPVCPLQRHRLEESRQDGLRAYHPSFWVSGAILSSTPSFSVIGHNSVSWAAHTLVKGAVCRWCMDREREREREEEPSIPRSLMLNTPLTVLLVLRCRILDSVGEAGASSMAESTLDKVDKGSCTSADMMDDDDGIVTKSDCVCR